MSTSLSSEKPYPSVDVVPDFVHGVVVAPASLISIAQLFSQRTVYAQLERKACAEDDSQHGPIPPEEAAIPRMLAS